MTPGALCRRVKLQSKGATRAANGEEVVTWSDVATVWAQVEQLRGREFFAGAQMQDAVDVRVTIRYRSGVVREMRVVETATSMNMDIVGVVLSPDRSFIELMCVSGVRNG